MSSFVEGPAVIPDKHHTSLKSISVSLLARYIMQFLFF